MKTAAIRAWSALTILPAVFASAQTPSTFGTTATSYVYVGAAEFRPETPSTAYDLVYKLTIPSGSFSAPPPFPSRPFTTARPLPRPPPGGV